MTAVEGPTNVTGLRDFEKILVARLRATLLRMFEQPGFTAQLAEDLGRELSGEPKRRIPFEYSPLETNLRELASACGEIDECLRALDDSIAYLAEWPEGAGPETRIRHLRYHLGHRMHELYMLRVRIVDVLKKARRRFGTREVIKLTLSIEDTVERALRPLVDARGGHVHQLRIDAQLVGGVATTFVAFHGLPELSDALDTLIEHAQLQKLVEARQQKEVIEKLVDTVFAAVGPAIVEAIDQSR